MLKIAEEAHRTDTGRQRHANEDALFAGAPLFAVADGMGGAQAGEVAAQMATDAFQADRPSDEAPEPYLRRVVEAANDEIHGYAQRDASRSGMGTTLTAALLRDDEISLAHVGDSRAYLLRNGELKRLTSDHSLVEELRRQGRLTEAQAEEHPQRSIITRALGPEEEVDVDTMTYPARAGDVVLLCSDGLTTMVHEPRIADILAGAPSLEAAVDQLVREANEMGGRDNITVVLFRLEEEGVPAEAEPTLVGPAAEEAGLTADRVAAAGQRPPPRAARPARRWPARLARVLVALVIVAGLGAAAWFGWRQVHFLGVDEGGRVALYRGLPYDLPFDVELYEELYSSPLQADSLPGDRRDEATDHELRSKGDAESLIQDLEDAAAAERDREAGQEEEKRDRRGAKRGAKSAGAGGGEKNGSAKGAGSERP
jgi:serine/threonine protein phosphatase PrpC